MSPVVMNSFLHVCVLTQHQCTVLSTHTLTKAALSGVRSVPGCSVSPPSWLHFLSVFSVKNVTVGTSSGDITAPLAAVLLMKGVTVSEYRGASLTGEEVSHKSSV